MTPDIHLYLTDRDQWSGKPFGYYVLVAECGQEGLTAWPHDDPWALAAELVKTVLRRAGCKECDDGEASEGVESQAGGPHGGACVERGGQAGGWLFDVVV